MSGDTLPVYNSRMEKDGGSGFGWTIIISATFVAVILLSFNLGVNDLVGGDEGYYGVMARNILEDPGYIINTSLSPLGPPGDKPFLSGVIRGNRKNPQREGEQVLTVLARHRATARFLSFKLCRHLVADDPPDALVERIAAAFRRSRGHLPTVYKAIVEDPEVGKTYNGVVKKIVDFGAFVEILPGKDGLLHISEIENRRINSVRDVLNEGDELQVKVIGAERDGKIRLSRKALLKDKDKERS